MESCYDLHDTSQILSPALVVFHELLVANVDQMIDIASGPSRLRPHCKTHKMRQVTQLLLERGIGKHKCATLAEAEMLAQAGARDVFLAYNLVGPNVQRAVKFRQSLPDVTFSVTVDHLVPLQALSQAMVAAGQSMDVLLDIDTGLHRTGLEAGPAAAQLYQQINQLPGINPGGLHLYDGQNHQTSVDQRRAAVDTGWQSVLAFRDQLVQRGWPVPRLVAGGTGSFPIYAEKDEPTLEMSPGTSIFFDANYSELFPDLPFKPAALLLTRVISRPGKDRVTCDLGYKACASDPPAGRRLVFPDLPDAVQVLQNEEHLVLQTSAAERYQPGDELLAIARHICPTTALHKSVYVVQAGRVCDQWLVAARDRQLTI